MTARKRPLVERVALSLYGVWADGDAAAKRIVTGEFDTLKSLHAVGYLAAVAEARRIVRMVREHDRRKR